MAEERTLGDALTLTPEKLAFIHGDQPQVSTMPRSKRGRKPSNITIEVALDRSAEEQDAGSATQVAGPRRNRSKSDSSAPSDREVLDELLVPLTTRLPHGMVQSLRRICLEQRLNNARPDSIQEIVEAALRAWLRSR